MTQAGHINLTKHLLFLSWTSKGPLNSRMWTKSERFAVAIIRSTKKGLKGETETRITDKSLFEAID